MHGIVTMLRDSLDITCILYLNKQRKGRDIDLDLNISY